MNWEETALQWMLDNEDLVITLKSWGVSPSTRDMPRIADNQKKDIAAIRQLDQMLRQIYTDREIPLVLRRHSPYLKGSMLDYMVHNKYGARYIINRIRNTWNRRNP